MFEFIKNYVLTIFKILLIHLIFRFLFFIHNYSFYQDYLSKNILECFVHGLRFDLHTSSFVLLPILLITFVPENKTILKFKLFLIKCSFFLSFVVLFVATICNFIDIAYYKFNGRRLTYDLLANTSDAFDQVGQLSFHYWYLVLYTVFSIILYLLLFRSIRLHKINFTSKISKFGSFFIFILISGLSIRGGLQRKPLFLTHSYIFPDSHLNSLILNSFFSFVRSNDLETLEEKKYFDSPEDLLTILDKKIPQNEINEKIEIPDLSGSNIVVLILESFSTSYMAFENKVKTSYTPFLDKLASQSLYFKYHYANGRRSIDAPIAIFAGVPNLMEQSYITSKYSSKIKLNALPKMLLDRNYETAFFHGGKNGTMFFDTSAKLLGFRNYFGLNEYPHKGDFDGNWGIYDDKYFLYCIDMLSSFKKPFFASIFSLSSHNPYRIPREFKDLPHGPLPIHQSIRYADKSLEIFFQEAKKRTWYKNTLFVITGDHSEDIEEEEFKDQQGIYRVPLVFFHGGEKIQAQTIRKVAQHTDIKYTIADMLNLPLEKSYLSNSLLSAVGGKAINQQGNNWWIMYDNFLVKKDPNDKVNLSTGLKLIDESSTKDLLKNKILATHQYYNSSLIKGSFR